MKKGPTISLQHILKVLSHGNTTTTVLSRRTSSFWQSCPVITGFGRPLVTTLRQPCHLSIQLLIVLSGVTVTSCDSPDRPVVSKLLMRTWESVQSYSVTTLDDSSVLHLVRTVTVTQTTFSIFDFLLELWRNVFVCSPGPCWRWLASSGQSWKIKIKIHDIFHQFDQLEILNIFQLYTVQ